MVRRADSRFDLRGGAVGDHSPPCHEHDTIGVGVGLLEVMGGKDDGLAAGGEVAHHCPKAVPGLDVEGDGRLVEHQEVGVRHQRDGEADPLGLPARQLLCAPVGNLAEVGDDRAPRRHRAGRCTATPSS